MKFHKEGITATQLKILHQLGKVMDDKGFYLVGGTALAIYYGHRRSLDLDWFTAQTITDVMQLSQSIRDQGIKLITQQTAPGTLHGQIDGVRVSILEYRYPLLQPLTAWPETGCALASLDDLACMKLAAIAERGSKKDFYDLYVLVTNHRSLVEMLPLYREKFKVIDISPVLYGLAYFDDAEGEAEPEMLWGLSWEMIKREITRIVQQLSTGNI